MKKIICAILLILMVLPLGLTAMADNTIYTEKTFYYILEDESITITGCFARTEEVTVPNSIAGYPVNTIATGAFVGNSRIKVVNLPDTITLVQADAFDKGITVNYANPSVHTHTWGDWALVTPSTLTTQGKQERACTTCGAVEEQALPLHYANVTTEGYFLKITEAENIDIIRYNKGHYNTSNELRASEGLVQLSNKTVASNVVDGVFSTELPDGGEYTVFVRFTDGYYCLYYTSIDRLTPYVTVEGVTITTNDLLDVKNIYIAAGYSEDWQQIKNNYIVGIGPAKLTGVKKYSYTLLNGMGSGDYTVVVIYTDATRPKDFLHCSLEVPSPQVSVNGLRVNFSNLDGLKCIRYAKGEYNTPGEIKRGVGYWATTAKYVKSDPYTLQFKEEGTYTVCVEYTSGYYECTVVQIQNIEPTLDLTETGVKIGNVGHDLYIIRWAPGTLTAANQFKVTKGNKYVKSQDVFADGTYEIPYETLSYGDWSLLVQYEDGSINIYNYTFSEIDY